MPTFHDPLECKTHALGVAILIPCTQTAMQSFVFFWNAVLEHTIFRDAFGKTAAATS
jgi:UPF0716 family protein affecting phage T7 exclusion